MATPKTLLRNHPPQDWEALPNSVAGWFDEALRESDPHPSRDDCARLADKFRIIANRCNNAALLKQDEAALEELKDALPVDLERRRLQPFMTAANRLLWEADKLENSQGGYAWERDGRVVTLADIQEMLAFIGASGTARGSPVPAGRPDTAWHPAAREIAHEIQSTMRRLGYSRSLSAKKSESITAVVGAAAVNFLFNIPRLESAGFVAAVRPRSRSLRKTF